MTLLLLASIMVLSGSCVLKGEVVQSFKLEISEVEKCIEGEEGVVIGGDGVGEVGWAFSEGASAGECEVSSCSAQTLLSGSEQGRT